MMAALDLGDMNDAYRQQIIRCAQALALAQDEKVRGEVAGRRGLLPVEMFTAGNLDKRRQKIVDQLESLDEVLGDFDERIGEFMHAVPLSAYDTGASDSERFLTWLAGRKKLSPEQHDHVTLEKSRIAVESLGRLNRVAHIRFQDLWGMVDRLLPELETGAMLQVHVNPIRVWSKFLTDEFLDEDAAPPCDVLFYAAGSDIRTAVMEHGGASLFVELEEAAPCTLDQWSGRAAWADRREIVELCRDTAEIGLVAFG